MHIPLSGVRVRVCLLAWLALACLAMAQMPMSYAQTPEAPPQEPPPAATETQAEAPPPETEKPVAETPAQTPVTSPGVPAEPTTPPEYNPFNAKPSDLFAYIPTFIWENILMNALIAWGTTIGVVAWLVLLLRENSRLTEILTIERNLKESTQRQLEFQALYDGLTQLPNRRLFHDRLLETVKMANRSRTRFGVMVTDLDHFKEVNDTMGHDAGDELLEQVSKRLRSALRESDTLARMGGDEFAIICPSVNDFKTASVVCLRIISCLQEPVLVKNKPMQVGISIGVALFPDHGSENEILLRRADIAMYRAKQKRNSYALYDPELDRKQEPGTKPAPEGPRPAEPDRST